MTLVVRGGTVVTPQGCVVGDVVVEGGRVAAVVAPGTAEGSSFVDAGGLLVLPGMVDAHVHLDEPGRTGWEGFDTGSAAAVAGGVTTLVDMPIDSDPPTVTAAAVRAKAAAALASSRADVGLWGGLVPGNLDHLHAMADEGIVGLKAFACPSGWDDFPPVDEGSLRRGAVLAGSLGLPVAVHCELAELGHTIDSEVAAVRWAAGVVTRAGAHLHVVHISSADAVDEARRWPGVTVETCAHYLVLGAGPGRDVGTVPGAGPGRDVGAVPGAGPGRGLGADRLSHCYPPIRGEAQREALWERVAGGEVDLIASDHSPCPPELRLADPPWAGVDGIGMTIPLLLSSGRLPVERIAALITAAARVLALPGKGAIAPGFDADLALVDPDEQWTPGPDSLWSRHRCSPYAGLALTGRVVTTLVRGRVAYTSAGGPGPPGGGRVIRPMGRT